jgi:hypothetical protein
MFCAQCHAKLPEHAQSCSSCGTPLAPIPAAPKEKQPRLYVAMWAVAAILGVLFAATIVKPRTSPSFLMHLPLGQTTFTVHRFSFTYVKFDVPANSTNPSLDGHFQASGGSRNDIEVYVFDQNGFVNWQKRHKTAPCFNSGRLTEGKISAPLPPQVATYYLVFNNKFSLLSPKSIRFSAMVRTN